jgi:protoporphyrinogen/coproporphyrinogen III oxidase
MRPRVAVVGGGITGLAAAHALAVARDVDVVVLEASERLGGKICTATFAGLPVEAGPDTILARVPWGLALLDELGLSGELVSPATGEAQVWARGRLRPLPAGLVLGVPGDLAAVARSGVLSPAGLARAALDLVLPASPDGDRSIAEVVGHRFGREVAEVLVEPMLSGINAGRADGLSLAATAPDIAAAARDHRSLLLALRARQRANPPDPTRPVFVSLPGGLSRLVDALAADLTTRDAGVRVNAPVTRVSRDGSRFVVEGPHEGTVADAVVIASPAFVAAEQLRGVSADAADGLRAIEHASVALATATYDRDDVPASVRGSGFLVPRREGWLLTATTFVSNKWPALTPPGRAVVRMSTGRAGDRRFTDHDDNELLARLHAELARATGITRGPASFRVDRWPDSFPQYAPGHVARIDAIERALAADAPAVVATGAAHRGVGIASCIRQGREAAARVLALIRG